MSQNPQDVLPTSSSNYTKSSVQDTRTKDYQICISITLLNTMIKTRDEVSKSPKTRLSLQERSPPWTLNLHVNGQNTWFHPCRGTHIK